MSWAVRSFTGIGPVNRKSVMCQYTLSQVVVWWWNSSGNPIPLHLSNIGFGGRGYILYIHVPARMNPTFFGDTLHFPLAPPWGWYFCFLVMSQQLWITIKFGAGIHDFQRMNHADFGEPQTFHLVTHVVAICCFWVKCLCENDNYWN